MKTHQTIALFLAVLSISLFALPKSSYAQFGCVNIFDCVSNQPSYCQCDGEPLTCINYTLCINDCPDCDIDSITISSKFNQSFVTCFASVSPAFGWDGTRDGITIPGAIGLPCNSHPITLTSPNSSWGDWKGTSPNQCMYITVCFKTSDWVNNGNQFPMIFDYTDCDGSHRHFEIGGTPAPCK